MGREQGKSRQIERAAREKLGYDSFRPGQKEAIESILSGRDTLAVMPTGAGKSAIYQLAGTLLKGTVVVISPLIALQKDQLEKLDEQGLAEAAVVNSTLGESDKQQALEELESGDLGFLFVTPEQLQKPEVLDSVRESNPVLFVVDEAHCISEWGHDFRPAYLKLGAAIDALGRPATLALTATASADVRREIVERLCMREPRIVVSGFDRPNISLAVEVFFAESKKRNALLRKIASSATPGIVYVSSRRHAEEIAQELVANGIEAVHYHAGMQKKERDLVQDRFMDGGAPVIVATSAFGMGIDKPDIRFVYHYDAPHSIDSYYQEIGRAGRDGEDAEAILFYLASDLNIHKFFAGGGRIDESKVERVTDTLARHEESMDVKSIVEETELSKTKVEKVLRYLDDAGAIQESSGGEVTLNKGVDFASVAHDASVEHGRHREAQLARIERMRAYAENLNCRREYLLEYFGEPFKAPCNHCDNCRNGAAELESRASSALAPPPPEPVKVGRYADLIAAGAQPFPVHTRVRHKKWGKGLVEGYDKGKMTVLFDREGQKTLAVDFVVNENILEPAN